MMVLIKNEVTAFEMLEAKTAFAQARRPAGE
jgi:hypothetical protein